MKRLIVKHKENGGLAHGNIPADRIAEKEGFIFAYNGDELVGVFDLGLIEVAYISERG